MPEGMNPWEKFMAWGGNRPNAGQCAQNHPRGGGLWSYGMQTCIRTPESRRWGFREPDMDAQGSHRV
jgi:hypothetical protein